MCANMCMDMGMGTCKDKCMDMVDMCAGTYKRMCIDMRTDMCVDMCIDMHMCMDLYTCVQTYAPEKMDVGAATCIDARADMCTATCTATYTAMWYSHVVQPSGTAMFICMCEGVCEDVCEDMRRKPSVDM